MCFNMTCVYVAVWPCHCETTPWCHSCQYTGTIPPKVLTHLWIISLSHPTTPALVRTTPAFCCLINNGAIVFDICQIEYAWYLRHTETTNYTYFLIRWGSFTFPQSTCGIWEERWIKWVADKDSNLRHSCEYWPSDSKGNKDLMW